MREVLVFTGKIFLLLQSGGCLGSAARRFAAAKATLALPALLKRGQRLAKILLSIAEFLGSSIGRASVECRPVSHYPEYRQEKP